MAESSEKPELDEIVSCREFEKIARQATKPYAWGYISGGEADSIANNEAAFDEFLIRPHVLADVSTIDHRCCRCSCVLLSLQLRVVVTATACCCRCCCVLLLLLRVLIEYLYMLLLRMH